MDSFPLIALELGATAGLLTLRSGGGRDAAFKVDQYIDEWLIHRKMENKKNPFATNTRPRRKPRFVVRRDASNRSLDAQQVEGEKSPLRVPELGLPPLDYQYNYLSKRRVPEVLKDAISSDDDRPLNFQAGLTNGDDLYDVYFYECTDS